MSDIDKTDTNLRDEEISRAVAIGDEVAVGLLADAAPLRRAISSADKLDAGYWYRWALRRYQHGLEHMRAVQSLGDDPFACHHSWCAMHSMIDARDMLRYARLAHRAAVAILTTGPIADGGAS